VRPTLLGQLLGAHTVVVAGTCAFLVLATMTASAVLLRDAQDRTVEATTAEVKNGIVVESRESKAGIVAGAEEYFGETSLQGFRFELLDRSGAVIASHGEVPGWNPIGVDVPLGGRAARPVSAKASRRLSRFRACASWCGPDHVLRVITLDVLHLQAVRRAAAVLLGALPLAAALGTLAGRSLFRRRLAALSRLETAVAGTKAEEGAAIGVPAGAREIATLQDAFNGLLSRLGEALSRERRFAQEAAHELRTPLATLRARLERIGSPEAAAAVSDVDALDRLVDTLLLLARSESAPLPSTPVNLCDLAREVAHRRFLTDGENSRRPEVEAPDEILVRGSEDLLARALSNLVDNSRKFGGRKARIVIGVREEGARAVVSVADDGPGIPDAAAERIFERFFRAPETRGAVDGAGLGLAVVRAIAARHQGTVAARRSRLGGAELVLELPALR
jgi:signal transduction histidine kinase